MADMFSQFHWPIGSPFHFSFVLLFIHLIAKSYRNSHEPPHEAAALRRETSSRYAWSKSGFLTGYPVKKADVMPETPRLQDDANILGCGNANILYSLPLYYLVTTTKDQVGVKSVSAKRKHVKAARRSPPGSVPGKLEITRSAAKPRIRIMAFGPHDLVERQVDDVGSIVEMRQAFPTIWIDIVQFGDAQLISAIGDAFDLHQLALEDAINTHQRPKVEEYDDHLFIVALMPDEAGSVETEQVAFFVGDGYLITFQERPGDCFENVRDRIRKATGRIRSAGSDYTSYALLDAIIDSYFPVLEKAGDQLEALEDRVISAPAPENISELHDMKRRLLLLRRAIWPHREVFNSLLRDEHPLIDPQTRPFLRDCYDHTIQLMDIVETYREMASGLVDLHISGVSMKLNEVMKVLTIVATVFMPLSFIASVYGMNFDREKSPWNMPELGWYLGYPFALFLMCASAAGLVWYIWKKGWWR